MGASLLAGIVNFGCSAASSTRDETPVHVAQPSAAPPDGRPNDAGLSLSLMANGSTVGDVADAGAFDAHVTSLQQAASQQEPLFDRRYRLAVGEALTTRKAMATKYADLTPGACHAELRRRRIAVAPVKRAVGVVDPMRLSGPLHGVKFVTPSPKTVYGILDCRLVLLLDDLAGVLGAEGVTTVYVDNMYRPKAHLPGKKVPSQHASGLAIDIDSFGMNDGRTLVVERDFAGAMGSPVCGEAASVQPESKNSVDLRNVVCAMARAKAFHYLLTPNHDAAHANHVHGDIKRGAREHVVR